MSGGSLELQVERPAMIPSDRHSDGSPLLTVHDIARLLRVHEKTVYELVRRGAIPHIRLGRCVRFSLEDVTRWLGSRKEGV